MNSIHPTAQLTGDVRLGSGNTIGAFAVITGPVEIGDDNWFGSGVVIGAPPEVRGFAHPTDLDGSVDAAGVRIGDRNVVREYAQIHQGWKHQTQIADDAFIMNQAYVAHDCRLDDGVTLASSVLLAGHVHIGAKANLGLGTTVHQFRTIGRGAMIGMSSVVTRDVPPFAKAFGNPAMVRGANVIGMERSGVAAELVAALRSIYAGEEASLEGISDPELQAAVDRWTSERPERGDRA
ncbi:UDP-N-acetylglucosamine acyltransferase [Agromyces sp. ISL-38]|uniref:acyl-ACP--UDP-N- acetylglucosamine O-acyltransferase n=1 Tax=Agromyces sp. ISL-38 TaxID=2819107 RepID=UPI001BECE542|nr:acyl-ACP--UDP-N- acetylglucosamine O-acyltransferase [Agromyces sp. ISL-38]MBT2500305.1 UDP-N-acetylglucosamine acyltransferase [Agromyces sp. ISL-38]